MNSRSPADIRLDPRFPDDRSAGVPDLVLELYLDVLEEREGGAGTTAEETMEDAGSALAGLEEPTVRYWLNRLDRLSWTTAVDPLSAGGLDEKPVLRLPRRTFGLADLSGARVGPSIHPAASAVAPPRIGDDRRLLVPVVLRSLLLSGRVDAGELPVGAVVVPDEQEAVMGRIGRSRIRRSAESE